MPNFRPTIRRGRTKSRGSHAPRWPFTLNRDSPQAQELVSWLPFGGNTPTAGDATRHVFTQDMGPPSGGYVIAEAQHGSFIVPSDSGLNVYKSKSGVSSGFLAIAANDVNNWPHGANGDRITTFCRMHATSAASSNWGTNTIVLVGLGGSAPAEWNMNLEGANTSSRRIWFRTAGSNNGGGDTNVPHDQWNDICATWEVDTSTGEIRTYLNGLFDKTASTTDTSADTNTEAVYFKDASSDGEMRFYDGRVYRRVLTLDEVHELTDPATKWDLFYELGRRSYFWKSAAGVAANPKGPLGLPLHGPFAGPVY